MTILAVVLFGIIGVGLYSILRSALARIGQEQGEADKRSNQYLQEGLQGIIVVRLRGTRAHFLKSYGGALSKTATLRRRLDALQRLPRSANEVALACMIVGATLFITLDGISISDALPTLSVFGFAGLRTVGVMGRLSGSTQTLKRKVEAFEKSQLLLKRIAPESVGLPPKKRDDYLKAEQPLPDGVDGRLHTAITLTNVSFRYPRSKKEVLSKVSLEIPKGANVAFCGPSGGGKSTLLLLLMGVLRTTKGRVQCDEWSIQKHIQHWHRNIGYVGQSPFLVTRSIRENVGFGLDPNEIDDNRVWRALKLASADEFMRQLPQGLESSVGDEGRNLSGGQRQRLAIARALYDDPDILILDEATAALDNATEREIVSAIHKLSGDKTIINVAHRLSSIEKCDTLYFVSDGRIEASGSYSELLNASEKFANMASRPPSPKH
jgi:ATP-binding cassette subfamily C protein